MQDQTSRRNLLATMGVGAAALITPAFARDAVTSAVQKIGDADILTFALNLEYLEAEFYAVATTGRPLSASDTSGRGTAGPTTGGRAVNFSNRILESAAAEIAADELAHVRFLRSALGRAAVAKPAINLDALGIGFASDVEFITLARAFEDVGVSAYRGAAKLIKNNDFLDAAAGILATECYHAGNLRSHAVYAELTISPLDRKDQPPTARNFSPTDANALAIRRTPAEVGLIVRGKNPSGGAFFPNGLNGKIR